MDSNRKADRGAKDVQLHVKIETRMEPTAPGRPEKQLKTKIFLKNGEKHTTDDYCKESEPLITTNEHILYDSSSTADHYGDE